VDNKQVYTDNITVWVSDDNVTWGVLQHNVGEGMGRFNHTGGYLIWNFSTNPPGVNPFTYLPIYGWAINANVTLYARYQLNITDTAHEGMYHNLSGSDWQISIANNSGGLGPGIIDTEHHMTQAVLEHLTQWGTVQTISGLLVNTTGFRTTQTINGLIQNISVTAWYTTQTINGTILNISTTAWRTTQTISGLIRNTSGFRTIQIINGTIMNTSTIGISIINIYPANTSHIPMLQPIVLFTLFNSTGASSFTVYTGNSSANATHYLFNDSFIGNGTYHDSYFNATNYTVWYYWKICAYDNGGWLNETVHFNIVPPTSSIIAPSNPLSSILGLFGIFGLIAIIFAIRRRRRR
jgi:hypothetical protein